MSRQTMLVAGIILIIASVAVLIIPLGVLLLPLIAHYYTVGLSADANGLRVIAAMGIAGGAGLVGGIWLIVAAANGSQID